ncbi:hypothetical protein AAFF_G00236650 [Aldrovandia affinis]|uniref:Uncharacterized protein n=1 Tax=Aldrovandia affinis TaxID=143900 RepID=A0AAD7RER6_9TELE|nr:hypothetical protein AAFF_G00236650 [Aldrovandia affinis]
MSRVILRSGTRSLNAYVLLDDGSERTILLHEAAQQLSLQDLFSHVERLWQLDTLPYRSENLVTRSKQDVEAIQLLGQKTVRVDVDGVQCYTTPLLGKRSLPPLQALKEAVLAHLCGTERRLSKDPERTAVYNSEVHKLVESSFAKKVTPEAVKECLSGWYIPHHMVHHNRENRIIFNCYFNYRGETFFYCLFGSNIL